MQHTDERVLPRTSGHSQADRERLLELLLAADRKQRQVARTIRPRGTWEKPIPLSFAQERVWFLDQLGLVGSGYNVPLVLRLSGDLAEDVLERSLSELVRRHETLRTRFAVRDGEPYQVIDPPEPLRLHRVDLSDIADFEQRESRLRHVMELEQLHRFDLSSGHPLRAVLVRVGPRERALMLTMHHIASDGWSLGVLVRELSMLYTAFVSGRPSPLPELPAQYADYAIWQRAWLQGQVLQQQLQYWRERLQGAPPHLQLPTDRPRPAVESFKGAEVKFELPEKLSNQLRELARSRSATLFMVVAAAYQMLLARWSGQRDIVLGMPIAGRTHREIEGLIGFFVNTLVLRTDLSGNASFHELLERVKDATLGAYAHQDLPFDALVKELRPERSLTRQPIYQATLGLQNYPEGRVELPGITCTWSSVESVTTHFDVSLYLFDSTGAIAGVFEYARDLFDRESIESMATQLRTLLESIVADPERGIEDLPLLTPAEQHRLVIEWNRTDEPRASTRCVHEAFVEQAKLTPDATALIQGDRRLTYRELDRQSNQLAHYLRDLGVGTESIVGLCFSKSPELVIALLAVLKAGGAYLPLDPSHPRERLSFMFSDAGSSILLTRKSISQKLEIQSARVVNLDEERSTIAQYPATLPDSGVTPRNLCYVIYTSGSTGSPKGVMVEHAGLMSYLAWARRTYRPESGDQIPISSPVAFDATATGLYCALLTGRSAVLLRDCHELEELEQLLQSPTRWSLIKVSPAHLQALGPRLHSVKPPCNVATIVVGGEALPAATVLQWRSFWPDVRIINQYGPTETVIACSAYEIPAGWNGVGVVPLGRSAPNVQMYVLDSRLHPVPVGVPGELYVGGAQVSRGYLRRPALTAERFIANPFGQPGSRLYRTGDLVRRLRDGNLEFLGRSDDQVKIRGYRIELREIESVLLRHAAVKQVAVVAREHAAGDRHLVAYVVQHRAGSDSGRHILPALKDFLRQHLPEYMIPTAWRVLAEMPLTSNGKIDRRALPDPEIQSPESEYVAPRTEVQRTLAAIWTELLHVDRVGLHDNFFELGGHSLHGMKLIAQVEQRLAVRLPVISIFQSPTIEQMAAAVEASRTERKDPQPSAAEYEEGVI